MKRLVLAGLAGLAGLCAVALAGCSATTGMTGASAASVGSDLTEMMAYAPPYTVEKQQAACAATDALAKAACVKLNAFAQGCLVPIAQLAAINNQIAGTVGTAASMVGQAGVATGVAVGIAANNAAVAPALTALQITQCQQGGFPMSAEVPAAPAK